VSPDRFVTERTRLTRSKFVVAVAVLGPFVWFFGPVLLQARTFGFRDAANYYYPLFHWECGEWAAGRIPLWNPLDNAGAPVLADTTSSVLYPGKLVFALPVSYRLRYHIYITMHLLLAAVTMYGLARRWRLSGEAAGLAAVSFAFGGSVVFQYCNVVFLVGAAWLPASLYAADRALCERSVFWSVLLGAVLALMTLGGDPQAAYHAGLLVAAYAFFCRRIRTSQDANGRGQQWWSTNLALLAVAAVSGFALALVQILPAIELTRQSDRAMYDEPRSIYEAIYEAALSSNDQTEPRRLTGIFKTPQPGTHLRHAYYYSMGPWHLVELGWPNISGRHYPKNQRWVTALPAEGRIWTPSLYAGLLPIVLGIGSWRIRKGDPQIRFLSWVTGIAVLASFGWYGLGWLWNELEGAVSSTAPHQAWIGDPVGGVYWFFVVLLPGYVNFRYPAKWLPVAALGISLLAARGWDRWREGEWPLRAWLFAIAAVSLAGAAVFAGGHANWMAFVHQAPPDAIFGPLDVEAATRDVLSAFAHTAVVSLGAVILLSRRWALSSQTLGQLVVLLTAVDLCVANGWMALTIDGDVLERSNGFAETIAANDAHADGPAPRLWRTNPAGLLPRAWSRVGSDLRMQDVVAWERSTLLPTHHLDQGVAILEAHTTLRQRDWASLERVMREFRSTTPQCPRQLERWEPLSSEFVLAPHSKTLAGCKRSHMRTMGGSRCGASGGRILACGSTIRWKLNHRS